MKVSSDTPSITLSTSDVMFTHFYLQSGKHVNTALLNKLKWMHGLHLLVYMYLVIVDAISIQNHTKMMIETFHYSDWWKRCASSTALYPIRKWRY